MTITIGVQAMAARDKLNLSCSLSNKQLLLIILINIYNFIYYVIWEKYSNYYKWIRLKFVQVNKNQLILFVEVQLVFLNDNHRTVSYNILKLLFEKSK